MLSRILLGVLLSSRSLRYSGKLPMKSLEHVLISDEPEPLDSGFFVRVLYSGRKL